jgi:HEPN domain-containing protein
MSDPTDPSAWVERAEEDYAIAAVSLRRTKIWTYGACFHAQQCAEKYLKAILVTLDQPFPKVHDLLALNTLCEQAGVLTGFDPNRLDTLSAYAVRVRYPGDDPSPDEARQAVEIAKWVRRLARTWLGIGGRA